MKPWQLNPDGVNTPPNPGGADAPAQTTTAQPWDRQPPESDKAPAQPSRRPNHVPKNSLTPDELRAYLEFSRRTIQARVDAENFEMAMMHELRLDFAQRRLTKLQQG